MARERDSRISQLQARSERLFQLKEEVRKLRMETELSFEKLTAETNAKAEANRRLVLGGIKWDMSCLHVLVLTSFGDSEGVLPSFFPILFSFSPLMALRASQLWCWAFLTTWRQALACRIITHPSAFVPQSHRLEAETLKTLNEESLLLEKEMWIEERVYEELKRHLTERSCV